MKIKLQMIFLGILFSFKLFSDGLSPSMTSQDQPWSMTASFGNSKYQHIQAIHKSAAVGRLALGNELLLTGDYALGLEFGLQNGQHIKLKIPKETLAVLGWIPSQTTLGPMLDLLITAKSDPIGSSSFFTQLKGGIAYRYWEFNHMPAKDIAKLAGEIQAGFGYPITALADLSLLYQGVFSKKPEFQFTPDNHVERISTIPTLHAVLLGLSINL